MSLDKDINNMQQIDPIAILILAAIIHASFQLGISVLTLMAGHALGRRARIRRVSILALAYSFGTLLGVALVLALLATVVSNVFAGGVPFFVWALVSGIAVVTGLIVLVTYYGYSRRQPGTVLWLPRPIARLLVKQARTAKKGFEAFSIGLTTLLVELIFTITPLLIAAFVLVNLPAPSQLIGLIIYSIIASLPHFIIAVIVGSGHSIAHVQKWRETNKRFIQLTASSALIIIGGYLYVDIFTKLIGGA